MANPMLRRVPWRGLSPFIFAPLSVILLAYIRVHPRLFLRLLCHFAGYSSSALTASLQSRSFRYTSMIVVVTA
jgi:hypothetical protein